MAHLYNNHGYTVTNPDDVGFTDYLSLSDIYGIVDGVAPLLDGDEKSAFDYAINVHIHHHDPGLSIQTFSARRWKMFKTLD